MEKSYSLLIHKSINKHQQVFKNIIFPYNHGTIGAFLFAKISNLSCRYFIIRYSYIFSNANFEEIRTPIFEATELFENYSARLVEHPTTKINYIDFTSDKPVAVSLVEEDEGAFIYKNAYVKATDLKKDKEFKAALVEAAGEYLDGESFAF